MSVRRSGFPKNPISTGRVWPFGGRRGRIGGRGCSHPSTFLTKAFVGLVVCTLDPGGASISWAHTPSSGDTSLQSLTRGQKPPRANQVQPSLQDLKQRYLEECLGNPEWFDPYNPERYFLHDLDATTAQGAEIRFADVDPEELPKILAHLGNGFTRDSGGKRFERIPSQDVLNLQYSQMLGRIVEMRAQSQAVSELGHVNGWESENQLGAKAWFIKHSDLNWNVSVDHTSRSESQTLERGNDDYRMDVKSNMRWQKKIHRTQSSVDATYFWSKGENEGMNNGFSSHVRSAGSLMEQVVNYVVDLKGGYKDEADILDWFVDSYSKMAVSLLKSKETKLSVAVEGSVGRDFDTEESGFVPKEGLISLDFKQKIFDWLRLKLNSVGTPNMRHWDQWHLRNRGSAEVLLNKTSSMKVEFLVDHQSDGLEKRSEEEDPEDLLDVLSSVELKHEDKSRAAILKTSYEVDSKAQSDQDRIVSSYSRVEWPIFDTYLKYWVDATGAYKSAKEYQDWLVNSRTGLKVDLLQEEKSRSEKSTLALFLGTGLAKEYGTPHDEFLTTEGVLSLQYEARMGETFKVDARTEAIPNIAYWDEWRFKNHIGLELFLAKEPRLNFELFFEHHWDNLSEDTMEYDYDFSVAFRWTF